MRLFKGRLHAHAPNGARILFPKRIRLQQFTLAPSMTRVECNGLHGVLLPVHTPHEGVVAVFHAEELAKVHA